MKTAKKYYCVISSPVGKLTLVASEKSLESVLFGDHSSTAEKNPGHPVLKNTSKQLAEYFEGKRKNFNIPLSPDGTDFQKQAWLELRKIPYGETISYQNQAQRLGDAKKARAVGTANSHNPISIIVPCHRVIAKNGSLSGFGGGVKIKKFLLQLEQGKSPLY